MSEQERGSYRIQQSAGVGMWYVIGPGGVITGDGYADKGTAQSWADHYNARVSRALYGDAVTTSEEALAALEQFARDMAHTQGGQTYASAMAAIVREGLR